MRQGYLFFVVVFFGLFSLEEGAFAQNIDTNASSTTVGSTQFGVVLSPVEIQQVMQSSVSLSCVGAVNATVCTPTVGQGTSTAFIRVDQLPGSFTDSPIGGIISATPNFACGASALDSNDCQLNMFSVNGTLGDTPQTAPNMGIIGAPRNLIGTLNSNIRVGDGGATTSMPDGFVTFTLDAATGATTIDQFVSHTIDLGGSLMVFNQRDATIALGTIIPDPIGGPLTLLPFTSFNVGNLGGIGGIQVPLDMVSRMTLDQGAADGFGALTLDNQVNWLGALTTVPQFVGLPLSGTFATPGLNTGIDPLPKFGEILAPEFAGFAFP